MPRHTKTRWIGSVALFLALLFVCGIIPARASDMKTGDVLLVVCNKGAFDIDAVELLPNKNDHRWLILGWITVSGGSCANVALDGGYIGFAYLDAEYKWQPLVATVPDDGTDKAGNPVFTRTTMQVCVSRDADTTYVTNHDPPGQNCADRVLAKHPDHKMVPFATTLYFRPRPAECNILGVCSYGEYYLDAATPKGAQLRVAKGLSPSEQGWQLLGAVLQKLAQAADEDRKAKQKAAAAQAYAASPEGQLQREREASAAREEHNRQVLAAAAAGNPNAQVGAQMIQRAEEANRTRWTGSHQSPASYDPGWMGQNMVITGTVSKVDVDKSGFPQWLTIYFKESPDATFVVCSPYPDLFQERVGLDLNALVGKTMQVAGQVEGAMCGHKVPKASIRALISTQWRIN